MNITLWDLASDGDTVALRTELLKTSRKINEKNLNGITPLSYCCQFGHNETAKMLITQFNANLNLKDDEGRTCLHWSCIGGHLDTAIMLIKYGCSITEIDNNKKTPLFYINNDVDKQKLKDCYLTVFENSKEFSSQSCDSNNIINNKSNQNQNVQKEITKSHTKSTILEYNTANTNNNNHHNDNYQELKKPLEQLSIVEVGYLINHIFPDIIIFQQALEMNCVNGEVLNFCETAEDLIEIGITFKAHARVILSRIKNYRETGGVNISHFASI